MTNEARILSFTGTRKTDDSVKVAQGLGVSPELIRSYDRPLATPYNLQTGRKSPHDYEVKYLLAKDSVNEETANVLLFDLFKAVQSQRKNKRKNRPESLRDVAAAGSKILFQLIHACLSGGVSRTERLRLLYLTGGCVVDAIMLLEHDDTDCELFMEAA